MKSTQIIASVLSFVLSLNLLPFPAQAQDQGKPIGITFGQPNAWSLEQAHYLLAQMRERSLGIKAKNLSQLDPNDVNAVRLNLIRQLFGLSTEFRQMPSLPNPASSPQPTPTPLQSPVPFPSPVTEPSPFTGTVLAELLKDKDFLKKLFGDAKLNATTQLDNHIQLQYEIIAKQLTLLRDEVGPNERLVFLELPQSIYSTPGKADNKVVQVYWQATGYKKINKEEYIRAKIREIENLVPNLNVEVSGLAAQAERAENELNAAKRAVDEACKTASSTCKEAKKDLEAKEKKYEKVKQLYDRKNRMREDLEQLNEDLANETVKRAEEEIERLKQGGVRDDQETMDKTLKSLALVRQTSQYETSVRQTSQSEISKIFTLEQNDKSKVRTVDIIPRQSSLNVNDIQETVKSTVISAAFSFLFGLGARTNYQRQQDEYEQYIHQELYASGFGKGESLFGWTFGAVPGTKRIAPGVRTTYAVIIVPREAESLILNARGCYFPRKDFQPLNPLSVNENNDDWWKNRKRECTDSTPQEFEIQIPNGGDTQGFWLTAMDYSPVKKGSQRLVASINGRNFTQQVGVLVDGIPLQQVVELTRKLADRELLDDFCRNGICGAYEVIDSGEITIAFQMPEDYKGTPEITVIGPGRSVSVNRLKLNRIQVGSKKFFDSRLTDDNVPFMFGARAKEVLSLNEFQVLSQTSYITALLTGTKFEDSDKDEVTVNGTLATSKFLSSENYKVTFPILNTDSYTVMVRKCRDKDGAPKSLSKPDGSNNCDTSEAVKDRLEVATKSFPIAAAQFAVTNAVALNYDSDKDVMFIRVEGVGLGKVTLKKVNGNDPAGGSASIPVSGREILIKITKPEPVVKLTLANPDGKEISVVVIRPIDETLVPVEQ